MLKKYCFLTLCLVVAFYQPALASLPAYQAIDESSFRIHLRSSQLDVNIEDESLLDKRDLLLKWVNQSAQTVQRYYGRFPVKHLHIRLQATNGPKVRFGQAFGGESPYIRIEVGEQVDQAALERDWIMVHEMVHLAMAGVPRQHRWLLEGLATYIESVARVQAGHLDADFVWRNFVQRMPQGLPKEGDRGLDHTPTWGRTYWGGAVFFLLADIEIRKNSRNSKSLKDALRGVLAAGYSMQSEATAMQIFEAGDQATGQQVLVEQYLAMRASPQPQELDSTWQLLGITLDGNKVVYDQDALLAWVRRDFFKP